VPSWSTTCSLFWKPRSPGRKPLKYAKDRRNEQLEYDKGELERKLVIAEKLMEPQKKHRSCWSRRSRQTNHERADCGP